MKPQLMLSSFPLLSKCQTFVSFSETKKISSSQSFLSEIKQIFAFATLKEFHAVRFVLGIIKVQLKKWLETLQICARKFRHKRRRKRLLITKWPIKVVCYIIVTRSKSHDVKSHWTSTCGSKRGAWECLRCARQNVTANIPSMLDASKNRFCLHHVLVKHCQLL